MTAAAGLKPIEQMTRRELRIEELKLDLERQRRKACRSLLGFTAWVNRHYVAEPAHVLIASYLDRVISGEIKRLLIIAPRQHGKSYLGSVHFPAYWLSRKPNEPIILASYAATLAEKFSRDCRQIVQSAEWAQLTDLRIGKRSQAVDEWTLQGHKGGMLARGVGGGITGWSAWLLLGDDLLAGWQEAYSDTIRQHTWDWFGKVFQPPLQDGGSIVLLNSRWHEQDPPGMIIQEAKARGEEWTVLRLSAVGESQEERDARNKLCGLPAGLPDPLGREVGEPLCPQRYSAEALDGIRTAPGMTTAAWEAEYMGAPSSPEGGIIKRGWLRYYADAPKQFDELMISVDCAFKGDDSSDFVCMGVWGREGLKKYLLDVVWKQMDYPQTKRALLHLCQKWPGAYLKLIEEAANGAAIIAELRTVLSGVVAVKTQGKGSKAARLHAVSHMLEAGEVYLPEFAPWLDGYTHELCSFTAAGSSTGHDDAVDMTSQALERWLWEHTEKVKAEAIAPGRRADLLMAEAEKARRESEGYGGAVYEGYS